MSHQGDREKIENRQCHVMCEVVRQFYGSDSWFEKKFLKSLNAVFPTFINTLKQVYLTIYINWLLS